MKISTIENLGLGAMLLAVFAIYATKAGMIAPMIGFVQAVVLLLVGFYIYGIVVERGRKHGKR